VLLLSINFACSVDSLDVYVPPRGVESIQQEDIRRDIWSLELSKKPFTVWILERAEQLNLEMVFVKASTCFSRKMDTKGLVFWTDETEYYRNVAVPALLSLAKSTDGIENPGGLMYCIGQPPDIVMDWTEIEIADVSGIELTENAGRWSSSSMEQYAFVDLQFERIVSNIKEIARKTTPYLPSDFVPKK